MNKRTCKILMIIILCMAFIWPTNFKNSFAATTTSGTVTASSLYIRKGPSAKYSKLTVNGDTAYLKKGEQVTILSEKSGWYNISFKFSGKSLKGYVADDYIKVQSKTEKVTANTTTTQTNTTTTQTNTTATQTNTTITQTNTETTTPTSTNTTVEAEQEDADFSIPATVTATTLNVREKTTTSSSKIAAITKNTKVTVLKEKNTKTGKWYRISFQVNTKDVYGYVLSDYIKLTLKSSIKANVNNSSKVSIRTGAGTKYKTLKYTSGKTVYLSDNASLTILNEVTDSAKIKWFKVTFKVSSKSYTGYIEANKVLLKVTNVEQTPTPTPTPTEESEPIPATVTASKLNVRQKPTTSSSVITSLLNKTPVNIISEEYVDSGKWYMVTLVANKQEVTGYALSDYIELSLNSTVNAYINSSSEVAIRTGAGSNFTYLTDSTGKTISLSKDQLVIIEKEFTVSGDKWFNVSFTLNKIKYSGYLPAENVTFNLTLDNTVTPTPVPTPTPTPTQPTKILTDTEFEASMTSQGFPNSYKDTLRELHKKYPTWKFEAYQTGLDWNTAIAKEGINGVNLISNGKSVEWKSLNDYNWKTDTFNPHDGKTWVTPSIKAVAYYMDPRNFLDEKGIFQFEYLSYKNSYQNATGVEGILYNTPLYNTCYTFKNDAGVDETISYAETFIKAAEYSGVSPYHLASRAKQEVVTGSTSLSCSVTGDLTGFEGLYNFYNIGATHSTEPLGAVKNGLKFAKNGTSDQALNLLYRIPWDSPYDSILGGAYSIGRNYVNRGQNTTYLQKFNMTSTTTYGHQYMANLEAPYAEAKKTYDAYSEMMDLPIEFSIPVYKNMPSEASPIPDKAYNPNNFLKTLTVNGQNLTLTFDTSVKAQKFATIEVENAVTSIGISAATASSKATIAGTGNIPLVIGNNDIVITVTAENGDKRKYTIPVYRKTNP